MDPFEEYLLEHSALRTLLVTLGARHITRADIHLGRLYQLGKCLGKKVM